MYNRDMFSFYMFDQWSTNLNFEYFRKLGDNKNINTRIQFSVPDAFLE